MIVTRACDVLISVIIGADLSDTDEILDIFNVFVRDLLYTSYCSMTCIFDRFPIMTCSI